MFKKFITLPVAILPVIFLAIIFLMETENLNFKKLSKFELLYHRSELEFLKTRDPKTNKIPIGIKERELQYIQKLPTAQSYYKFDKNGYPSEQSESWSSIGPQNIAGRIKDVEFDAENNERMICVSASGGVWVSDDFGNTWRKTNSPVSEQTTYCIEQDKRQGKTNNWYYGTGELLSTTNRQFTIAERTVGMGNGIYKSINNGLSWFRLESTKVLDNNSLNNVFQGIWEIKVDNNIEENDDVYAACSGGIFKSSDGGNNWKEAIADMVNKCFSSDIDISSNQIYYAALSAISQNNGLCQKRGIYRSKDGKEWKDITPQGFPEDTRVVKIQSAPSNGNILYVFTESPRKNSDPSFDFASSHHTFWKYTYNPSLDRGNWEDRTEFLPMQDLTNMNATLQSGYNSLGGYCFTFNVYPDNENVVFIGGTNLFRSEDGFATKNYMRIGGYNTALHPDNHSISFYPNSHEILINGSDGGVNIAEDCLSNNYVNWHERNNGLTTSQFYSIALDHASSNDKVFVGGLQDQGTVMKNNSSQSNWMQIFGGDGLSCFVANEKNFVIVSMYNGIIFGGKYINNFFEVEQSNLLISDELFYKKINFFTIFEVEPINNNELYLAVNNSIYRKNNLKEAINQASLRNSDWQIINTSVLSEGVSITAVEMSKKPQNRLYYGTDNGKVYRIDDANRNNSSRIEITDDEFPTNAYVSCIVADPFDSDKLFVTFSNYNVQSIFYSEDGGASWSNQGGNLEEHPDGSGAGPSIRCLEILHKDGETIYYTGTSSGLFSTNFLAGVNTVWVNESPDMIGNIKIDMITARQNDACVVVATQGNGAYINTPSIGVDGGYSEISNFFVNTYPQPAVDFINFSIYTKESGFYELKIFNELGNVVDIPIKQYISNGKFNFIYNLSSLNSGTYFYAVLSNHKSYKGKFIVL